MAVVTNIYKLTVNLRSLKEIRNLRERDLFVLQMNGLSLKWVNMISSVFTFYLFTKILGAREKKLRNLIFSSVLMYNFGSYITI